MNNFCSIWYIFYSVIYYAKKVLNESLIRIHFSSTTRLVQNKFFKNNNKNKSARFIYLAWASVNLQ